MMASNPRTMIVNVYDRNGTVQSSYRNCPEEKRRIPRMEATATVDEAKLKELHDLASSSDSSFKMNDNGYCEIFIGAASDWYDYVTRNVNHILFAEA